MGSCAAALVEQGYCEVEGGKIWYEVHSPDLEQGPALIFIHGGPGYTHNSFKPLSLLSEQRKIVFYDQLGCGKSDRVSNPNLWTIERHVEELKTLTEHLGISSFYLLGHSWGSVVALEFSLKYSVQGLIFASPCISVPLWIEDSKRLRKKLPDDIQRTLKLGEQLGEFFSEQYLAAVEVYAQNFICRLNPKPQELLESDMQAGAEVYLQMWGPNEFTLLGSLANYDGSGYLGQITVPVVYTCGAFDEATPDACRRYQELSINADLKVFESSAHFPQNEQSNEYLSYIRSILHDFDHQFELANKFNKPSEIFAIILLLAFALLIVLYIFVG